MKKNVHLEFYEDCRVTCACGHSFITGSTQKEIKVEICSQCHPFFTGEMKYVDIQGRVEKFQKQVEKARKVKTLQKNKKEKRKKQQSQPKTLKEAFKSAKKT